jgi:hypothetical protein
MEEDRHACDRRTPADSSCLQFRGARRAARGLQGNVRVTVRAFLMPQIGFAGQGGLIYTILVAVGGAVVLTGVVRALKRA